MNMKVLKVSLISFFLFIMLLTWDEGFFTIGERLLTLLPILFVVMYDKRKIITDLFGEVQK